MMMLLVAAASPSPAAAQQINMTAGLELSSTYRTDCWQGVHLEFRNDGAAAVDGSALVPLADPRYPAAMSLPINIPPNTLVRATIWAYFAPLDLAPQKNRKDAVPPLALTEFRGREGALLSRAELAGVPVSAGPRKDKDSVDDAARSELILVVGQREEVDEELYETTWMIGDLSEAAGVPMAVVNPPLDRFPRQAVGLQAIKAVVLDALDPDAFDLAQRAALLEYVRGGGVIAVCAPTESVAKAGSWLAPLLPVKLVGQREAKQIEVAPGGAAIKLSRPARMVEAVEEAGAQVLLRDQDYVHVAVRPIGMGKVVFTSFPVNALEQSQPQVARLWEQLLSIHAPPRDIAESKLGETSHAVLGSMVGRKVAPWGMAGALAGGYLLVILLAQGLFLGPARPKAAIVSGAAALLLSGTLVAMSFARHGGDALQSARLAVVDATADGATRQESVAFIGVDDPVLALKSADEHVSIRPALADSSNRPLIRQQPFAVENAGVFSQRIERVWAASGGIEPAMKLDAVARFTDRGVTLEVSNELGRTLESPLLISRRHALSMNDLPTGKTTVSALRLNPRGDFTDTSVLASEHATRRGQIVNASLTPLNDSAARQREQPPAMIGWIDEAASAGLIQASREVADPRSMVMVRTPLRIEPPQVGTKVLVPAPFVQIDPGRLLYDLVKDETVPSREQGNWLVKFSPPPQLGQLRTGKATLELRVSLPAHTMTVRKGQAAGGEPKVNLRGEMVAQWSKEVSAKNVVIDIGPNDADRDGGVWLLFEVAHIGAQTGGTPVPWQIKELGLAIEGEVAAPPRPIVLDPPPRPFTAEQ